ncbi:MAG: caspase family protein [Fimbriimonadaceae bacterium]|nr:hypothetical protein [Chthonomonadaceae bacterium]MCO5295293.1 caspase family protein [Fimbriimonadaceae bacterium]
MKLVRRVTVLLAVLAMAAIGLAQSWSTSYEEGLQNARAGLWAEARQAFQQAAAYRPEDYSGATLLPGPVSERRQWRDGAPYSPNFMAAYSAYRAAMVLGPGDQRSNMLRTAAQEFEALLAKRQFSRETFYFLNAIYVETGDTAKAQTLEGTYAEAGKADWRVDAEVVAPDERAAIEQAAPVGNVKTVKAGTDSVDIKAGDLADTSTSATGGFIAPLVGRVAPLATKFALVIGNSEGRLPQGMLPFGADDAAHVREALITHGGYPEGNVDLVANATSAQILASARAMAQRVGEGNTVTIFFAGVGVNLDGKDYLAGIEAQSASESTGMVAKSELYKIFMAKGAKIFAFFEANRPIVQGRYFGMETPLVGAISQAQATLPGDTVFSSVRDGKPIGVYGEAMASVLSEMRSNRIPILEFGWQVFYRIRRGDTGSTGGASQQTPTLPVLSNMASDARF